jgi:hypothetical protein
MWRRLGEIYVVISLETIYISIYVCFIVLIFNALVVLTFKFRRI